MDKGRTSQLFGRVSDPYDGPKPLGMRLYEYYSRSTHPLIADLRSRWNTVFAESSIEHARKGDLRRRFSSPDDATHMGAVFEFIMYELCLAMRCELRCEPPLGDKRPDFEVQRTDLGKFYLEATCAMCEPPKPDGQTWREDVYEALNSVVSDRYRIVLRFDGYPIGKPNCLTIQQSVRSWLESLDYDALVTRQSTHSSGSDFPELICREQGMVLSVSAMALKTPKSSKQHGLVWIGPVGQLQTVVTDMYLIRKLRTKEKQIRAATIPAVVAVNLLDHVPDDDTILDALGAPRGIWCDESSRTSCSISAIMLFCNASFHFQPSIQPMMILNPHIPQAERLMGLPYLTYCGLDANTRMLKYLTTKPSQANGYWPEGWPSRLSMPELG